VRYGDVPGFEPPGSTTKKILSTSLNLSFLAFRAFMRWKAEYSQPILMMKNAVIWIPALWPKDRRNLNKQDEGSLYEKVHVLSAEVKDYRATLESVMRFAQKSLEEDRRRKEDQMRFRNISAGIGGFGGGHARSSTYDLEKIIEGRQKLTGNQGYLANGGQLYNRIQQALDYANEKQQSMMSRRGSIVAPEELKAKFRSHVESIESEVKCVKTETDIIFQKLERAKKEGGADNDASHIEALHASLNSIKEETLRTLEAHRDKEYGSSLGLQSYNNAILSSSSPYGNTMNSSYHYPS
jgi:hypothetical protein